MKGTPTLIILGILVVVGLFLGGVITGVYAILVGPQPCGEAPFASNCFCQEGYEKVMRPWVEDMPIPIPVMNGYTCETEGQQQPYTTYAQTRLFELFPQCDMIDCDGTVTHSGTGLVEELDIQYGYGYIDNQGLSVLLAECKGTDPSGTSGHIWWAIYVRESDGSVWYVPAPPPNEKYPYCISSDGTKYGGY